MRGILLIFCICCFACSTDKSEQSTLFNLKDNTSIGIDFSNDIKSTKDFNVYKYRNFYNGGGVALGDINNDGLIDIYLVANQKSNKLYLNKGDFIFEDITDKAGVSGTKAWSTGVTLADVNADGFLDIYVCNSGDLEGDDKESELFINNGDMTFSEKASEFGLNDKGYSTHASFFDYDRDGDLDVYLLNNSYAAIGSFNLRKNQRPIRDELGGDKLLRNDGEKFTDVSQEAGIYGSEIGFGLGITVSDFNNDNWPDMFISNDFFERDYLYINNQDGSFKESLTENIHSISAASMGADAADINNDGYSDLFVTDMLPFEYERLKTVTTFDDWNRYKYNLKNDYHHQFTRNVLQLNQEGKFFTEVSRKMNVDASDWSWGALFFDMDNDGFKDLFIANGIYKDLTNQDYLEYIANESIIQAIVTEDGVNYKELIDIIPSNQIKNMAFTNQEGKSFELNSQLGLDDLSFSNGSAYGDLDNDGDLDLVVNNLNMPCFIYENNTNDSNNHLRLVLKGEADNPFGTGAIVNIKSENHNLRFENVTCKGFQSTVDHRLTIGLGQTNIVDIEVIWPSGKKSFLTNISVNQELIISESEARKSKNAPIPSSNTNVFSKTNSIAHVQIEKDFSDFNQERLIFWMRNTEGGSMSMADLNGDSIPDLFIPGSKGTLSQFYTGSPKGFIENKNWRIEEDAQAEWIHSNIVDIDQDGDLDILLAAGGVENSKFSPSLIDQIYLNDGKANFSKLDPKKSNFPKRSNSTINVIDFDQDGDLDILSTERIKIAQCGKPCSSQLFENLGSGSFKDVTDQKASSLRNIGMVTSSVSGDFNGDGILDLILAGEFMPLSLIEAQDGTIRKSPLNVNVPTSGIWSSLHATDIDNDGDLDLIAGNAGTNSRFKASSERPMKLFFGDYDNNGFEEGILCHQKNDNKYYPYSLRHDLIDQMKSLKKTFPDFESFKNASITDIIGKDKLDASIQYEINNLETLVLINDGKGKFTSIILPEEVQYSSVFAIECHDFDGDGDKDIVLGGNLYTVLPEMGISDASRGLYLENKGDLDFTAHVNEFNIQGEIRDFKISNNTLLVNVVNDSLKTFSF